MKKVGSSSSLSCRETILTRFEKAEGETEVGPNLCCLKMEFSFSYWF